MICGDRLRETREAHNYSQQHIANVLHVSQRVYSNYEHNEVRISVDTLCALAKYYNLSLDYLSGISDEIKEYPKH